MDRIRLTELAEFLETLPEEKFNFDRWCGEDSTEHSCGSCACVAGWAADLFIDEGWAFNFDVFGEPTYGNNIGPVESFAEFFEISHEDAYKITMDQQAYFDMFGVCEITPRMGAAMIRKVMEKYE